MLGEQLCEERGQVTGVRVLASASGPRMEISFQASGTIYGEPQTDVGTYELVQRSDGLLFGEGQGMRTTAAGEVATWKGQGVGRTTPDGGTEFRGALYHETSSARLERLNGIAAVFEYSTDASGKTESRLFEWT